ncbi:MAG: glycosyltransferase family 39 protein [Planctomycetota bacterium]|nr:glycosyltransferase family 39 protein [Planctomycetota bacterium]
MPPESSPPAASLGQDAHPRPGRGTWAWLALIVLLGLAVRLHGIGFLSPQLMEPDGVVIDYQMRVLDGRGPETAEHPLHAYYPHLLARIASLVPESWVAPADPRTLEDHLRAAGSFRMRGRIAVALLSLLAIPLTWWLARRFLPDPWPLLAAALAAASPFVVWFAQQARPHAAAASFLLLAVCAAVHLRRRGGWRAYLFAGLSAGLAVGSLQNGVAALGPIAVAVLLRWREDRARILAGFLAILAITAAFVIWLYPFLRAGAESDGVGVDGEGTLALSRHQVYLGLFNGRGFATVWRSLVDYDPLLTAFALFGLAAAAIAPFVLRGRIGRERAFDLAVVLAYALPYLLVIGLYQRTYQRFVLPLVPFLALLAAFGLFAAARAGQRAFRPAGQAVAGLAILVAGAQFAWSWRLGTARSRTDTIQEAADWLARNAQPDSDEIDATPGLDLPLNRTPASIRRDESQSQEQNAPWFRHLSDPRTPTIDAPAFDVRWMDLITTEARQRAHADAYAFARTLTGRYAVVLVWPAKFRPAMHAVREGLKGQYELAARFSPDDPDVGDDLPLTHQDDELPTTSPWAWRILHARCVGPSVEIYRLR